MTNGNQEQALKLAVQSLQNKAPREIARCAGCPWDEELSRWEVVFLNQLYFVNFPSGVIENPTGDNLSLSSQILILHYLLNASGISPSGQWISFKELPGGAIYIGPFTARSIAPMTRIFGKNIEGFIKAANRVGAVEYSKGDAGFIIQAFPHVSVALVLWAADEEFPASGSILFDSTAPHYLPTEDYAVLAQTIVFHLKKLSA